jgi:anti-sigma factor RsiW
VSEHDDIACREMVELMSDYLEGVLPSAEKGRLETHLAGCDGCEHALGQLRETLRLTGMLRPEQVPDEDRALLLGVYRAWRRGA